MTATAEVLTRTQQEPAAALADLAQFRDDVERILASVTDGDADSPDAWFWLTMTDQERDEKAAELHD